MPGFRGDAGGDDADIGALDRLVGGGAGQFGIEAEHRRGLGDVERLAVRDAFRHVEEHDVAELLEAGEKSERATDLTGADQGDLGSGHVRKTSWKTAGRGPATGPPT